MIERKPSKDIKKILDDRALLFAKPKQEMSMESQDALLLFFINKEKYAIKSNAVISVLAYKKMTVMPFFPDPFLGLFYNSGLLFPVMDLALLFLKKPIENPSTIILLEENKNRIALLINDIIGKETYKSENITSQLFTEQVGIKEVIKGIYNNDSPVIETSALFDFMMAVQLKKFMGE